MTGLETPQVELGGEGLVRDRVAAAAGLGGERLRGCGAVAQRRLGRQELEGAVRIVEGLLAAQPGGGGMAAVVADAARAMIRRAYSAVCSRPGMMPGWKLRTTRALASRPRTESWTAARPLSLMRKAASWTAASASASRTARR